VPNAVTWLLDVLQDGQHLVLRSTVYPGVTKLVEKVIAKSGKKIDVSFCPERIAEGKAVEELIALPQIISARTPAAVERAKKLFSCLTQNMIVVSPEEAELAKLFTNTWRYIKFAAANQLYTIANDFGVDFERVRHAITHDYPRAADMPGAGFAAGPCLFKDTMQLAAFNNNNFTLGHSSMMINEGLPLYLVSRIEKKYDLTKMTVGVLGMAFKAESDDIRSSLSYKLKRILRFKALEVVCADSFVRDDDGLISEMELSLMQRLSIIPPIIPLAPVMITFLFIRCKDINRLFFYNLIPNDKNAVLPSAGNTPGPGYPPALRVKYFSLNTLLIPALMIIRLGNLI
jgi:UDP-N-acetyl-D-mannosaminuronic acid dehydrogenase